MIREYGRAALEGKRANEVSSLVPGVMAQTGMETLEIIKGVVEERRDPMWFWSSMRWRQGIPGA